MSRKYDITATCYDKKGRVLSIGKNSYTKTHPMQAHFAKQVGMHERTFLHAEIKALLRSGDKQVHAIRIERYAKDGKPMNAAPCPICQKAINAWGVKEITHTL